MQPLRWLMAALTLSFGFVAVLGQPAKQGKDPAVIHLGLVDSLLKNLSDGQKELIDTEFPTMVKDYTGFKSKVFKGGDFVAASKKLAAGEWHLAVLQGVEFAWAQTQDAKLQPLLVALKAPGPVHAFLVVKNDSELKGFADLKGKDVRVLQGKEHCRLFADKGAEGNPEKFYGKLIPTKSVEATLDDVVRGKIAAAVVDHYGLDLYKDIQPGRFERLKVLVKSERFPPIVIVHREGALSDNALKTFSQGMLRANESEKGRRAMEDVGIQSFEAVPGDFADLLTSIVKAYPAPGAKK